MYLFVLGGIVIVCCLVYIFVVDHPEYFVKGKSRKTSAKPDFFERQFEKPEEIEPEDEGSKVIYLPGSPEEIEAEKARRNRRKK